MARRISWMGLLFGCATLFAFSTPARADFSEKFEVTVPLQNTDLNTTVALPMFQPQGNEKLLGVTLALDARLSSAVDLTFTSLSTLTLTADALVSVVLPDGTILSADPSASTMETLSNQMFSTTLTATSMNSLAESTSPALLERLYRLRAARPFVQGERRIKSRQRHRQRRRHRGHSSGRHGDCDLSRDARTVELSLAWLGSARPRLFQALAAIEKMKTTVSRESVSVRFADHKRNRRRFSDLIRLESRTWNRR